MAENTSYDAIVIGSGPGGYVLAIRLAQLGFNTALVEKWSTLGGTCLNVGCIPSKALLDSSEHFYNATNNFEAHGIKVSNPKVDLPTMIERKAGVVKQTVDGVKYLMKKNKVDVHHGWGSFVSKTEVKVTADEGKETVLTAPKIIIATGSEPASIPGVEFDGQRIISSTEALELQSVPKTMLLIGGGIIGLEMGSVYARLGTKVQVVEYMDGLIPTMDRELGKDMQRILKKHLGMEFFFKHKVKSAERKGKTKVVVTADDKGGQEVSFEADYCLMAVGRRPYTDKLGLENAGVQTDEKGRVQVNDRLETNVEGIYAIGDVVRGAMLAHKASDEAMYLAELLAGQHAHINYRAIPSVVYTWPEVAGVGYTEEELKEQGLAYKKGKFPFAASGRARASMDTDGFIKVLADKETDELLGVHMIGPRVADVIAEAVVALEYRASAEDIGIFSHAHPTYTESFKEAALAATGNRAIHM